MSFDRNKLDFLKSQSFIVDLYQYLFAGSKVEKIGKDYVGDCPYCGKEKHLYLYQNEDNGKCPVFVCYSCNKRGDSINLVEQGKKMMAGQSVMWFVYQWSGLTRDDFLRKGSSVELNDETYRGALNHNDSIQYDIWKKKEEESLKKEDFDFKKEIFSILESHIKSEPEFLDSLKKFLDVQIGGEAVIHLRGWDIRRVLVKSKDTFYYYWRAFRKNYSQIHIGSALDIEDAIQKIEKRMKQVKKDGKD